MSKVYVVVAHGDNDAKYKEDCVDFAFLKYPPALEEACIKHDVIAVDDREDYEKITEWTTDDNGQTFLTYRNCHGDEFHAAFNIEEFELGEYEVKEKKFRPVPFEGSEAQKELHDISKEKELHGISKGIIMDKSKDAAHYPGYSPWGDYDFNACNKEEL